MPRLTVLLFCLLVALPACGPRLEVARDRVLTEIDGLVGELEVRRKEIDLAVKHAETTLVQLKRGRIEVQVRSSQISCDLASTQDRLAESDRGLARLRDLLAQGRPVEIAGTSYTSAQVRGMASRAISTRKGLAAQVETLQRTHERLENVVALLESREQEGHDRLDGLKGSLVEIDAKAVALKAIQEAARVAEDAGVSDFESLERQIRDLGAKIDAELAYNEEVMKQATADSRSLDSILRDTRSTNNLVMEIDKLLGSR